MQVQVPMLSQNEAARRWFCCGDVDLNASSPIASHLPPQNQAMSVKPAGREHSKVKVLYSSLCYTSPSVLSAYLA